MFYQASSWFMDIVRGLIGSIDYILFVVVRFILVLIFDMANYEMPFDRLSDIYDRMFVLISVFMVFKLTFTFFQYLMNPDRMSDNKTGLPKLFRNAMIMIVLMILLPMIFTGRIGGKGGKSFVVRLQNAAIPTLTRVLLGSDATGAGSGGETSASTVDSSNAMANEITLAIARAFIHPSLKAKTECGLKNNDVHQLQSIEKIPEEVVIDCHVKGTGFLGLWGDHVYKYSYTYILPAAVAIMMGYILLKMTLSVGKRVFKLMILEIIAPIPVMSLIDPQSLDKGDSPFNSWLHSFISTFLEIFFQLGILYLFIIFIDIVISKSTQDLSKITSVEELARTAFLSVALILSLLFFAGEAPGFIKKALGIKDSGDDMGAIMGAALGGAAGAMMGGASGLLQGIRHGNPLQGIATGAHAGFQNGSKAKSIVDQFAAMHAGGEAAAQTITGNKNYRTGLTAALGRHSARERGLNPNNLYRMGKQKEFLQTEAAAAATRANQAGLDLDKFKSEYDSGYVGPISFTAKDGTVHTGSYDQVFDSLSAAKIKADDDKAVADTAYSKAETDEKNLKAKMEANGLSTNITSLQRANGYIGNNIRYTARNAMANSSNATIKAIGKAATESAIARGGTKVANNPHGPEYTATNRPDRK